MFKISKAFLKPFLASVAVFAFSALGHTRQIITDLDDTVKITNVNSKLQAPWNALIETKVFTGMPQLLIEMKNSQLNLDSQPNTNTKSQSFINVVSGSPALLEPFVTDLLYLHKIDYYDVILLGSGKHKPKTLFKLATESEHKIILLGDDQENDPRYYVELKNNFSQKVQSIYIHRLNNNKNSPLPEGVIPYFTAYEVALHEATNNRLSLQALERVRVATVNKLVQANHSDIEARTEAVDELFPKWARCDILDIDTTLRPWLSSPLADKATIQNLIDLAFLRCNFIDNKNDLNSQLDFNWNEL